jgi:tRNA threonylcarbamoyladenosine biosynthesis protein TsaE
LVEAYEPGGLLCVHVDLYRLRGPAEVLELGLADYLESACLMMVEWPERGGAALPPPDLELTLTYSGAARCAGLESVTPRGRRHLAMLRSDTSLTPYVSNLT